MAGLIEIYIGDGKGKTTAAAGLCVRCRGRGRRVVLAQFLKTQKTGEISVLENIGVQVERSTKKNPKFVYQMTDEEKAECAGEQARILAAADAALKGSAPADLLVLDEVIDAVTTGMLGEKPLLDLLDGKPAGTEIVITGHSLPKSLEERADYITEMKKIKHPYDKGVMARSGIEY
jgi:cob(I)alamin adenosyltransferase